MKRFSYLYDSISTIENVKLAYYKACKGKRSKKIRLILGIIIQKILRISFMS